MPSSKLLNSMYMTWTVIIVSGLVLNSCASPTSPTSTPTITSTTIAVPTPGVSTTQSSPLPTHEVENPTASEPADLRAVKIMRDIAYHTALNEEVIEDKLDIYTPIESGDWPVVVVFHGGSSGGKDAEMGILSNNLAVRGAVVFTPNIHSKRAEADEPAGMREFLEKDDCAVRFAYSHAAEYGGDPANLIAFGNSAGGYGGLWVALVGEEIEQIWDNYNLIQGGAERQVSCLAEGSADNVDAFVGFGGAYAYFEVSLGPEDDELLKVLSPSSYFGRNPELVIRFIHGKSDLIVPNTAVEQHRKWIEELVLMEYDATWKEIAGSHGLDARTFEPVMEVILGVARR